MKVKTAGVLRTQNKEYFLIPEYSVHYPKTTKEWTNYGHVFIVVDINKISKLPGQVGQAIFTKPFVLVVVGDFAIEYYNSEINIEGDEE